VDELVKATYLAGHLGVAVAHLDPTQPIDEVAPPLLVQLSLFSFLAQGGRVFASLRFRGSIRVQRN